MIKQSCGLLALPCSLDVHMAFAGNCSPISVLIPVNLLGLIFARGYPLDDCVSAFGVRSSRFEFTESTPTSWISLGKLFKNYPGFLVSRHVKWGW